jgi:hypothetical protein
MSISNGSMQWYQVGRECVSLRKHVMRVDMRIYGSDSSNFNNANDALSHVKSLLTAALINGLDVVGIVTPGGAQAGWSARALAKQSNMDIYVIPGEDYLCADKVRLMVYQLKQPMPPNLTADKACSYAHGQGGFIVAAQVSKRQAQQLNHLVGQPTGPDAAEIYCEALGGYQYVALDKDFQRFVTSGAKSATDLEKSSAFTLVDRKALETMGLLPVGEGEDYTPPYLKRDEEVQNGASESGVAAQTAPPRAPAPPPK